MAVDHEPRRAIAKSKNKFSNLVERAQQEEPQIVTTHGKWAVVVLSVDDYKKITKPKENRVSLLDPWK
ncbi:MAG: type II toxin-antitoxin system Phd/YefM family antitoxin [Desulfurivibrionaceae bacterium]|jgi:prevent-host-death family protein|nr:type II toxin-antitoxin system Phd/YefM family antitoxin [Pseudomonadota bacterium]MCG2823336.1 type II toxin-antitoxin system Phd/YefM family antitoxin [Desulfobulbaceae bacterium]MDP2003459.1 type II toxin-antitoxin system Phd/YefM family antitoxin [Desulfurivibrionaceae bacterium]PKN20175.1 MAG: hypothetical protein CVU68_08995 [Deltaproteobacteria bacterium HGW-Deltaproteobacteria-3]MBU4408045.1 type II toxin-antitoxin system Phd/YefM family antitoxin [Pseudomonadota bacterium]